MNQTTIKKLKIKKKKNYATGPTSRAQFGDMIICLTRHPRCVHGENQEWNHAHPIRFTSQNSGVISMDGHYC